MIELSDKTSRLLDAIFFGDKLKAELEVILVKECGNNIPFCKNHSPEQMERIRFSVLKLSEGEFQKFEKAIELAKTDWRDLFMAAGFGYDVEAHNKWYEQTIKS